MADLKLKDLRYLVAVADTRHFGQAAARCFVSQPTLSAQLKKLEDYLGVQLVERHPRRIALTEAGAQVVARARRIIEASDEIVALTEQQRDPLAGRLRMALLPTIGPYLLPLVASRIRKKLPRVELLLYEYQTGPMLDHLHAGDIDLGILALPVPSEGLVERNLFDEPFVVAVPEHHALSSRRQIKTSDLDGETLLLLEDGHCLKEHALAACNRPELRAGAAMMGTSLHTLVQMVDNGLGITMLPEMALQAGILDHTDVVARPLDAQHPSRRIALVWRNGSPREKEFRLFAKALQDAHQALG